MLLAHPFLLAPAVPAGLFSRGDVSAFVAGTGKVGDEHSVIVSGLTAASWQWLRDGVPIDGATSATYTPGADDDLTRLSVSVNGGAVVSGGKLITYAPAVATGSIEDVSLVENDEPATGDASTEFTGAVGGSWRITGAEGATIDADGAWSIDPELSGQVAGRQMAIDYVNSGGPSVGGPIALTLDVAPAPPGVPVATTPPSLSGAGKVGQPITLNLGVWTEEPELAVAWRADGVVIDGETGTTFTPGGGHDETTITARVTASNITGSTVAFTAGISITETAPTITSATISPSSATAGQTLAANVGTTGAIASMDIEWIRGGSVVGTGAQLVADLAGSYTFRATVRNSGGQATLTSAPVTVVNPQVAPQVTVGAIVGGHEVGAQITGTYSGLTGNPVPTVAHAWLLDDALQPALTAQTITAAEPGVWKYRVTASNGVGSPAVATSAGHEITGLVAPVLDTQEPWEEEEFTGVKTRAIALTSGQVDTYGLTTFADDALPSPDWNEGQVETFDVSPHFGPGNGALSFALVGASPVFTVGDDPRGGITDADLPTGYSMTGPVITKGAGAAAGTPTLEVWAWQASLFEAEAASLAFAPTVAASGAGTVITEGEGKLTVESLAPVTTISAEPGDGKITITQTGGSGQRAVMYRTTGETPGEWQRHVGTGASFDVTGLDNDVEYEFDDGAGNLDQVTPAGEVVAPTVTNPGTITAVSGTLGKVGTTHGVEGFAYDGGAGSLTYVWERGGTPIGGATSANYVAAEADDGTTLTRVTTVTNSSGADDGETAGQAITYVAPQSAGDLSPVELTADEEADNIDFAGQVTVTADADLSGGTWSVQTGTVPAGMTRTGGVVHGTPTTPAEEATLTLRYTNSGGHVDVSCDITVAEGDEEPVNLIVNGTFDDNGAGWDKESNWAFSGGQAHVNGPSAHWIWQEASWLQSGHSYKIKLTITWYSSGSIRVLLSDESGDDTVSSIELNSADTFEVTLVATGATNYFNIAASNPPLTNLSIDNVEVYDLGVL